MFNLPSTKFTHGPQCLEQSWRRHSATADMVIKTSMLPCPCCHLIGKTRHSHSMESSKIKEHFKGKEENLFKKQHPFQFNLCVHFFLVFCFCFVLFPVYVLFYGGSLGKGHIEPIQGIK